ncbi:pyridine nucleotide-disulfide oxidoreductase [Exiguobacterium sp. N4-1P]|uniref:dihydrolipoyl dehydrogenase family protein n=1 Tax=Exiguobacterium sp. N4-1P TaxID=2051906 RepID=UPI000B5937F5|nr:NAD(P)/FAD-dependent oxidoreductase [Exiguobacterium sp. N4-1P]ASI36009.1 pyridine nucleotide-disulfide oxidoreductase [Exiguobacterium sp. N4-1P]
MRTYDCIIIGTGSAGNQAAYKFVEKGFRVAIIENFTPGGTCAQRGCDAKKILLTGSETKDAVERLLGYGLKGLISIDWRQLMERKNEYTRAIPEQTRARYDEIGIDYFHGEPRFLSKERIVVDDTELEAKHFLIATGLRPRELSIPGSERFLTSNEFLELRDVPRRLVCIGGGYISFEFAHLARIAGAEVTIVLRSRPLKQFEQELVEVLLEATQALGIKIVHSAEAVSYHGTTLQLSNDTTVETDVVLNATGRVASVDQLDLEKAGVEYEEKGIHVNEYLQSSTSNIFAAGDVALSGNPALTPFAGTEGSLAAHNMIEGPSRKLELLPVPSVVFTAPNVTQVGQTEAALKKANISYRGHLIDTSSWQTNVRIKDPFARAKVLIGDDDQILGAHFIGVHAAELANYFSFAMQHRIPSSALQQTSFAYPTPASDISSLLVD